MKAAREKKEWQEKYFESMKLANETHNNWIGTMLQIGKKHPEVFLVKDEKEKEVEINEE